MTTAVPEEGDTSVPLQPRRKPNIRRGPRPVPATRQAADELFRPRSPWREATGARLERLNNLGLLELRPTPAEPITQQAAHQATLDAMYGPLEG